MYLGAAPSSTRAPPGCAATWAWARSPVSVSAGAPSFLMPFLPYLSSAFVPTRTMLSSLHAVSENQPIIPVIETVRGLLTGPR
ncbi:hypothetical protein [Streptosporangium sp. NPDC001681]|uniref:hypothetical protein n=1 Tax=Streptosporangium sp. NPDC001681 TaxID=3154395 RepID=UPI003320D8EC